MLFKVLTRSHCFRDVFAIVAQKNRQCVFLSAPLEMFLLVIKYLCETGQDSSENFSVEQQLDDVSRPCVFSGSPFQ